MITLKRILCPVDSSTFAERALRHGAALAHWYRAELTALSVRPSLLPPALWLEYPVALPLETAEERGLADEAVHAFVRRALGDEPAQVVIRDGPIVPEILKMASELPADLIVMGTHGTSGLEGMLLGSVTEKVLRKAACPVLTVPRLATPAGAEPAVAFKTIVCGIDFSRDSSQALELALSLALEAGGRLLLVHTLELFPADEPELSTLPHLVEFRLGLERETRERLAAMIPSDARSWCEADTIVAYGRPEAGLLRIAAERQADLIVLGVHGRNAVDLTLFGSTTHRVLHGATCPVLTVPRAVRSAALAA